MHIIDICALDICTQEIHVYKRYMYTNTNLGLYNGALHSTFVVFWRGPGHKMHDCEATDKPNVQ